MKKSNCDDCYNNVYNKGLGGAKECWMFKDAVLIKRKEVSIHQQPPWNQKAKFFPNCYQKQQFNYIEPNRVR